MSMAGITSSDSPGRPQHRSGEAANPRLDRGGRRCHAWYWKQHQMNALPDGIAKANGRLESEQLEIATKFAGRIAVVLAGEGQMADAGEVIARMHTTGLEAQLQAAEAQTRQAEYGSINETRIR